MGRRGAVGLNPPLAGEPVLFIVVAVIYGLATRGRKIPAAANIVSAIAIIVVVVALGYNLPKVLATMEAKAATTRMSVR